MDRRRVLAIVVGVLGVVALVLAGATLTNPDMSASGESGGLGFEGDGTGLIPVNQSYSEFDVTYPPFFQPVFTTVMVVFLLVGIVATLLTFSLSDLVKLILGVAAFVLVGWLLLQFLSLVFGGGGGGGLLPGTGDDSAGLDLEAPESSQTVTDLPLPVWVFLALVVLIGVVIIVGLSGATSTGNDSESEPDEDEHRERLRAVGDAAGRAATRLEAGDDATNAVYEAWAEMTAALDVPNPDATTPAAFARAAVDAGMAQDDVDELTQLFVDVRYGDASVSPERERQAKRALERIESTYADFSIDESTLESELNGGGT